MNVQLPPGNIEVSALADRICEATGKTHTDILLPALACVMAGALLKMPGIDPDEALRAFAQNVRGVLSLNPNAR